MMGVKCLGTSVIVLVTGLTSRESVICWRLVHLVVPYMGARAGESETESGERAEQGRRERIYHLSFLSLLCFEHRASRVFLYNTRVHDPRATSSSSSQS